jgi:antitoxin (DNA-binding transcriptional repressor) of toxin-antitoxin stability system
MPEIIGVKQLHKNMKEIAKRTANGESFIVVSRSKPIFQVVPHKIGQNERWGRGKRTYTLKDFEKLQFSSGEKDLSKKIDKVVYGL